MKRRVVCDKELGTVIFMQGFEHGILVGLQDYRCYRCGAKYESLALPPATCAKCGGVRFWGVETSKGFWDKQGRADHEET